MKNKVKIIGSIVILAIILVAGFIGKNKPTENQYVSVHFIDVSQGDCQLIELPEGKTMLIDAGDNGTEDVIIDYIDELGIKKIDYILATHPHADHIGGMAEIISHFDIGEIFMPRVQNNTKTFEDMLEKIDKKSLTISSAYEGKIIFDYSGVKAEILSPKKDKTYEEMNNYSAVVKLTAGEKVFLFMGDAEKEIESAILNKDIKADVLKVGHHGSSTSSGLAFLKKVSPEYAVISCGADNDYGHPHKETMNSLEKVAKKVLRTDKSGTIIIRCDGSKLDVLE